MVRDQFDPPLLNSGAVHPPQTTPRGAGTFAPIDSYRYGERKLVSSEALVQRTVLYSVPDVRDFVIDVSTR